MRGSSIILSITLICTFELSYLMFVLCAEEKMKNPELIEDYLIEGTITLAEESITDLNLYLMKTFVCGHDNKPINQYDYDWFIMDLCEITKEPNGSFKVTTRKSDSNMRMLRKNHMYRLLGVCNNRFTDVLEFKVDSKPFRLKDLKLTLTAQPSDAQLRCKVLNLETGQPVSGLEIGFYTWGGVNPDKATGHWLMGEAKTDTAGIVTLERVPPGRKYLVKLIDRIKDSNASSSFYLLPMDNDGTFELPSWPVATREKIEDEQIPILWYLPVGKGVRYRKMSETYGEQKIKPGSIFELRCRYNMKQFRAPQWPDGKEPRYLVELMDGNTFKSPVIDEGGYTLSLRLPHIKRFYPIDVFVSGLTTYLPKNALHLTD